MSRAKILPALLAAALLGVTAVFAACGGSGDNEPAAKKEFVLRIGDLVSLTGDASAFGLPAVKSADLAAREIKRAIARAGVKQRVIIDHEDDQTDPVPALSAARKLVTDGATCITGPWTGGLLLPLADEVSGKRKIPTITPAASADQISDLKDHGFVARSVAPDSVQGPALAKFMDKELGGARGKTVNIGARDVIYGRDIAGTFTKAWRKLGGKIGVKVLYRKKPDYQPEAKRLTSGSPDAWAIFDLPETYHELARALRRTSSWTPAKTFVTDGLASQDLPGFGKRVTAGMRGIAPGEPDTAAAKAFNKLYKSAPGAQPQTFTAQNFDNVILCYLAAVAARSTAGAKIITKLRAVSGPPGKKYTWQQLPQAIRALQAGKDINYEGVSGPIDLDESGDPTVGCYDTFRYTKGKRFIPNKQFAVPGKLEIYGKLCVSKPPPPKKPPKEPAS